MVCPHPAQPAISPHAFCCLHAICCHTSPILCHHAPHRGEALMHAQQATREAEMQQLALAETLQQALAQLGIDLTPGKPSPLLTPLPAGVWWDLAVCRASVRCLWWGC